MFHSPPATRGGLFGNELPVSCTEKFMIGTAAINGLICEFHHDGGSLCGNSPPATRCGFRPLFKTSNLLHIGTLVILRPPPPKHSQSTQNLRGELCRDDRLRVEVPRGEKMLYSGTDPESYITEYTSVYEENTQSIVQYTNEISESSAALGGTVVCSLRSGLCALIMVFQG